MTVIDNTEKHRFELVEDGFTTFANYRRSGNDVAITHVETPVEARGKGSAGRLMQGIVDILKAEGATLVPICPYAVHWVSRHQ